MTFKPGIVTNPNGRPKKKPDPRSEILEELCKKHREDIDKVVEVAIKKAIKGEDRAIKLVTDIFVPKAGTFAPTEKNTTHNKMNVQINTLLKDLSPEHHASLWEVLNNPQPKPAEIVEVKNSTND